ncbi:unnamed protein product (macronuclear) [Paramecium tetraurelia]|uniref:Uncharacterized protein n=1 Tax=Paramecium tetraurelia TaxID=5888 RepID=A0DTC1_PARTE|nr:uncharacterized protein GSPATT00019981001 [Paramecium tetraurelia]CAK86288.1 unnamed protein product [Paramecium tetraurelia]|eukprot:XP_001453685.1 hypothetical protein (macronuclear) [Paramecium tetraurelia strain d4-2]
MLKFEAFKKQQRLIERSPQFIVQQLLQRKIVFIRENFSSKENFMIQKQESQEIIYLKPECGDQVMNELTRIAMSEIPENEQLEYHIRAQQLLDYFTQNQIQVQYTTVLFHKINYALALRKYGLTEEVINLLLDSDQILKIKGKQLKKQPLDIQLLARIVQNKLMRLRIIFQCTLLFSESRRNKQALELAKNALKQLKAIYEATIKLCQQMNLTNLINKKQRANSEMSLATMTSQQPQKLSYSQIVEMVFKEILALIKCSMPQSQFEDKSTQIIRSYQSRSQSLDKYSEQISFGNTSNQNNKLYPNINDNHPMLQMQILGLIQMTQVDIEELYPISNPEMVVTEEVVLELIMLAGLSFYSISTELRFINSNFDNRSNLEIWLCKSLEIYYTYVPHMSQIFNQIYQVYKKLYGVDKQMIPEDQEITHLTKLLRPHQFNNKATLANKVVIVIKVPEGPGSANKHANTQQKTIPSNKTSKKHLLTQVEDQEDTGRSPSRIFLKPTKSQQPLEIKQRVDFLMNHILTQQAKLSKEKMKIIKSRLKPDLSNGNVGMTASTNTTNNTTQNTTQNSAKSPPKQLSRSLSNSRKASQCIVPAQLNIQQALQQTRTAQLKYRYRNQFNTLPIEESPTQFSSQRKQGTLDSAKKQYQNKYQLVLQQKLQNLN